VDPAVRDRTVFYWEHLGGRDYRFRGEDGAPDTSTAMADWNGLQIRLV